MLQQHRKCFTRAVPLQMEIAHWKAFLVVLCCWPLSLGEPKNKQQCLLFFSPSTEKRVFQWFFVHMDIVRVKICLKINQPSVGLSSLELISELTSRCSNNICQRYLAGFCHACLYRYDGHMTGLIMDLKALPLQNMCMKSRKVSLQ